MLLEPDGLGGTREHLYCGVYAIVDNGYLDRTTLISPIKRPGSQLQLRWSKWIESLRKDVECTFGIIKGRFRCLKSGVRLHGVGAVDDLWATVCALHNYLLESDELDGEWNSGMAWLGVLGHHDAADAPLILSASVAARLRIFLEWGTAAMSSLAEAVLALLRLLLLLCLQQQRLCGRWRRVSFRSG